MTFDAFLRVFLACYFGFVALHYTARLMGARVRTGVPHAEVGAKGSANARHQIAFRVFRAMILLVCIARMVWPELDPYLIPIPALAVTLVEVAGVVSMVLGLGLVDYAHSYLGNEWRSGMARGPGDLLVMGGPYGWSRNPIFAGVLLGQFGFMLAFPSLFTLLCFAVGVSVILRQTRLEEAALLARHGDAYARYLKTVPRWFGPRAAFGLGDEAVNRLTGGSPRPR